MLKRILVFFALSLPALCFSQNIILPSHLAIHPENPGESFPQDVQNHFSITASGSSDCDKTQEYVLTLYIYRNAVDNKVVAIYRGKDDSTLCWIDLMSYTDKLLPDMTAGGWDTPSSGQNTWCNQSGLSNTLLCALKTS